MIEHKYAAKISPSLSLGLPTLKCALKLTPATAFLIALMPGC